MSAVLDRPGLSLPPGSQLPQSLEVRMRRMAFDIASAEIPPHWVGDSKFLTHWFNALSTVFPEGEKFFIDSVRQLEHRIQDPVLREQVRGFIGQEGHHTYQHRVMNDVMRRHGLDAARYERRLKWFLDLLRRYYPKRWQLAVTCAIEHFTAILGHQLLAHDYELPAMHPAMAPLWRWHAVEETEHKAVCFDVYRQAGGGYWRRALLMVSTTLLFFPIVWSVQLGLMWQDKAPTRFGDVLRGLFYLWGAPGPLRRMIPDYLRYYSPRFHPWQHENTGLVQKWLSDERTAAQIRG